jgi:hypothetical protein
MSLDRYTPLPEHPVTAWVQPLRMLRLKLNRRRTPHVMIVAD